MATTTDIPSRDSLDGASQLALLRSYLKDSATPYQFPDAYLIPLLILDTKEAVWRSIKNIDDETVVPFTYDEENPTGYLNVVRVLTDDMIELEIKNTDYDISRYLEVLPLKRLIQVINAKQSSGSSICTNDKDHPIAIVRRYLDDSMGLKYTDDEIADRMLSGLLDPYSFVLEVIDHKIGEESASVAQSSTNGLASIDGISFDTSSSSLSEGDSSVGRSVIAELQINSIYNRERGGTYTSYIDGVDQSSSNDGEWYEL